MKCLANFSTQQTILFYRLGFFGRTEVTIVSSNTSPPRSNQSIGSIRAIPGSRPRSSPICVLFSTFVDNLVRISHFRLNSGEGARWESGRRAGLTTFLLHLTKTARLTATMLRQSRTKSETYNPEIEHRHKNQKDHNNKHVSNSSVSALPSLQRRRPGKGEMSAASTGRRILGLIRRRKEATAAAVQGLSQWPL